ncbi:nuclear transport factor 2 family protein [Flavobacterium phycosphaerae]|uniref:nuclear transport factor 2 family protein n=1 Tax=Flavobacterium phycosphaerae TaxID=2697515 RepID=UPI00138AE2F1|nr:nuclear transport factor 2 family protein [Flavobacterium phycosphaerae]
MCLKKTILLLTVAGLLLSCGTAKNETLEYTKKYHPDNPELYNEILKQDSLFFGYYNTCEVNLEKYGNYYDEGIEFYHDQGGLMTSKTAIIESTKKYICGKVTRTLVKGSVEVYPIKDFGAIEIGLHYFKNNTNPPDEPIKTGRFMIVWEKKNNAWKIKKVVSLH